MLAISRRDVHLALSDMLHGILAWNLWHVLTMQELRQRYRRSVLGPLWISVSLAVQVAVMGVLIGFLFKQDFVKYLPYATLGIILWNFFSSSVIEGANCFIGSATYLFQAKRPLFAFVMHVLWRNLVYLAHTAIVYAIVALIFQVPITTAMLLLIPAFVLLILNMSWLLLLSGVVATRFRDVQMILQSSMTVLFWLTPIVYYPDMLGKHRWIVDANPLAQLIHIVRGPLLGDVPAAESWLLVMGTGIVGWAVAFLFLARFRARIPYWL